MSNYKRSININRGSKTIEVGTIDKFQEVIHKISNVESETINGSSFYSFHEILGTSGQVILTAYKSKQYSDVMLIVWRDFPYAHHIEQGGDLMTQEIKNNGIKYLLIDNTFVQSGWMNKNIEQYFSEVWYPSLIQVGLLGFAHIEAKSTLGGLSFQKFREATQGYLNSIGAKMMRKVFQYLPVEAGADRTTSLKEGLLQLSKLKG